MILTNVILTRIQELKLSSITRQFLSYQNFPNVIVFYLVIAIVFFFFQFPLHTLTAEAVWPGLYVDKDGEYWDVPLSVAIDLASLPAESGLSYHLCLHHPSGTPKKFNSDYDVDVEVPPPASLLPGLSLKSAVSYRANMDLWRGITPKLEACKPYDIFLSSPHVSVSGIIGMINFLDSFQKQHWSIANFL